MSLARRATATFLLATLGAGGCYKYAPVDPEQPAQGTHVRAYLSVGARERLNGVLPEQDRYVDGLLISRDHAGYLLEMEVRSTAAAVVERGLVQRIPLSRAEVVSLQVREFDRLRTGLAAAAVAAVTAGIVVRIFSGRAGGGAFPPADGGQTESVVPVLPD